MQVTMKKAQRLAQIGFITNVQITRDSEGNKIAQVDNCRTMRQDYFRVSEGDTIESINKALGFN